MTDVVLRVDVHDAAGIAGLRLRARDLAASCGLPSLDQWRVALGVSQAAVDAVAQSATTTVQIRGRVGGGTTRLEATLTGDTASRPLTLSWVFRGEGTVGGAAAGAPATRSRSCERRTLR